MTDIRTFCWSKNVTVGSLCLTIVVLHFPYIAKHLRPLGKFQNTRSFSKNYTSFHFYQGLRQLLCQFLWSTRMKSTKHLFIRELLIYIECIRTCSALFMLSRILKFIGGYERLTKISAPWWGLLKSYYALLSMLLIHVKRVLSMMWLSLWIIWWSFHYAEILADFMQVVNRWHIESNSDKVHSL